MLKVGLIGLGFMGQMHLENYIRLEAEGFPIRLTAVCEADSEKLQGKFTGGNIDTANSAFDMGKYNQYTNLDEMLEKEQFDYVDITLPTYLHAETTIKALNKGFHVFCEKPMALNARECEDMIAAAKRNGKQLMIGQCLRFWPAYENIKAAIENDRFGKVLSAYFYRGSGTPRWSKWLTQEEKSKGCILDMHVHDVDMIHWLFGKPDTVSTLARNVLLGSGYDVVSTHYIYEDGKVINAQADWTLQGDYGFEMSFRVNFERGNLIYQGGVLKVNPNEGKGFVPVLSEDTGYYRQIKYFAEALINDLPMTAATPESTMGSIEIVEAEIDSADHNGSITAVKK